MTPQQQTILSLIRTIVGGAYDASMTRGIDWARVREEATKQGVQGLCFDALELLPAELRPDKKILLEWLGQVAFLERLYEKHKMAIDALSLFYQQHDIKMMMLKGYGLSLYWPKPNHRPVGDMDIYLDGKWRLADQLVSDKLGIKIDDGHEHHTCFVFQGVSVENHYDFVNTKANRSSRELETVFKKLATFDKRLRVGKGEIFLPSPTLNTIFLIRHLGQHFAGAEATFRQILDWGFFVQHEVENVDWDLVGSTLKRVGGYRFFQQINAICVDYLGFSEASFPKIERDNALERRILEDICSPEFSETKPVGHTTRVIWFKTRRFFANRWKRRLVYREGICRQLWYGSIAHLRRFKTIKD